MCTRNPHNQTVVVSFVYIRPRALTLEVPKHISATQDRALGAVYRRMLHLLFFISLFEILDRH